MKMYKLLILPVDQNVGTCLVNGSTCAPLQPPSFDTIHLKNLQKNRAALLRPIALQRPSQWLNHQILQEQTLKNSQGTVQCSLSQYAQELRKRKEYNLNVRTSEVRWETHLYLVTFSLLAVTHLNTWLASSRTRAIIWSLLDLGAAFDSPLAKLLMHGAAQCIANLGARSLLELAS